MIALDAQDHSQGVDFGLTIDSVQLGRSGLAPGQGTTAGTSLISGVAFKGMLGPVDIVVDQSENNINVNAYFSLDGTLKTDWYIPLLLNYKDMTLGLKLHNERGEDVLIYVGPNGRTQSFAHLQADIGAPENDGLTVNLTDFSGDMDWTDVTFGSVRPPVGDVYWTDLQVQAELKVYGH